MTKRGSLVEVEGLGGQIARLRVWETRNKGLLLCTEEGFGKLLLGQEAPVIGFPMCDIRGLIQEGPEGNILEVGGQQ